LRTLRSITVQATMVTTR
nr:immunoglobulin heavy chain junction region [Mus musculus]